jgi:hypothetical protein
MVDYVTIKINNMEYAINPIIAKALLECCSDKITLLDSPVLLNDSEE